MTSDAITINATGSSSSSSGSRLKMAETGTDNKTAAANGATEAEGGSVKADTATVRSITLHGFGGLRMVNVQKGEVVWPKEGEVLIRIKAW